MHRSIWPKPHSLNYDLAFGRKSDGILRGIPRPHRGRPSRIVNMMGSAIVAAPAAAQDVMALLRVISDPDAAEEALKKIEIAQEELRAISAKIDEQHNSVNNAMLDLADRT